MGNVIHTNHNTFIKYILVSKHIYQIAIANNIIICVFTKKIFKQRMISTKLFGKQMIHGIVFMQPFQNKYT